MTEHAHHDHEHGNERRVLLALVLTVGFMVAEVVGGLLSGSLALLADAGHMLTDTAALGLAWHAFRVSRRPATPARSYGHARFQVLAALINGAALFVVAIWIITEAIARLRSPIEVLGGPMLLVASLGLAVNIAAYLILHPKVKVWVLALWRIPIRITAAWALGIWIAAQFGNLLFESEENVAWWAHIGGLLAGATLILFMRRRGVVLFDRTRGGA